MLRALADDAKAKGIANATPNKMARALMLTALNIPAQTQSAMEIRMGVYSMRQQINRMVGELLDENLEAILARAAESS